MQVTTGAHCATGAGRVAIRPQHVRPNPSARCAGLGWPSNHQIEDAKYTSFPAKRRRRFSFLGGSTDFPSLPPSTDGGSGTCTQEEDFCPPVEGEVVVIPKRETREETRGSKRRKPKSLLAKDKAQTAPNSEGILCEKATPEKDDDGKIRPRRFGKFEVWV